MPRPNGLRITMPSFQKEHDTVEPRRTGNGFIRAGKKVDHDRKRTCPLPDIEEAARPAMYLIAAALFLVTVFPVFRFVRRDYLRHGLLSPAAALLQCAVFGAHAFLLELAIIFTDWPARHGSTVSLCLGLACGAGGLVLLLAGFRRFGSLARILGRESDSLILKGIYRWSRNPQLAGYGLLQLGFAILWPDWRVCATLAIYAVAAHRLVLIEEEHLLRKHGKAYRGYCKRTARYWPFFRFPSQKKR